MQVAQQLTLQEQKKSNVKDLIEEPAVDANFDFLKFPELTVDEQIASIPPQFLEDIEFESRCYTKSHPTCMVTKHPDNHHGSWACDMVEGASTCLSGITDFYQSKGIAGWRCANCDWDLCIKCMKADKFIAMVAVRED